MSVQPNSRHFQARRAAERYVDSYLQPSHRLNKADSRFRVILAFMQGADWERRRWIRNGSYLRTPEANMRFIRLGWKWDTLGCNHVPRRTRDVIKVGAAITGNALPPGSRVASVFDDGHGGTP